MTPRLRVSLTAEPFVEWTDLIDTYTNIVMSNMLYLGRPKDMKRRTGRVAEATKDVKKRIIHMAKSKQGGYRQVAQRVGDAGR